MHTNSFEMVDVTGIDRVELLRALWDNAKPAGFFAGYPPGSVRLEFDASLIDTSYKSVDYFCGKCIKAQVFTKENTICPELYDREYGKGAFQKIVDELRNKTI